MKVLQHITRHAADERESITALDVLINWDWRIVRLAFVVIFVWAGIVQVLWADESHLKSITFFYTVGAAASAVCSLLYWQLVRYDVTDSDVTEHRYRLYVQIAGIAVWLWTGCIDIYAHFNEIVYSNSVSWLHHVLINITIIVLLLCLCLNEIAAIVRAEKKAGDYE